MFSKSLRALGVIVCLLSAPAFAAKAKCPTSLEALGQPDLAKQWNSSVKGVAKLRTEVLEHEELIHALGTAMVANDFAILSGPHGGGKSFTAGKMFDAEARGLDDQTKKTFHLQMHQLIAAGYFTGFPNIERLVEGDGVYELNLKSSLIHDKFLLFLIEEIDKAHPANLQTLLSLLNERRAFLGGKPVDLLLRAGAFTTNQNIEGLLASYKKDRPSGQALLDRMGVKVWVKNKMLESENRYRLKHQELPKHLLAADPNLELQLTSLQPLVDRVKIPDDVLMAASRLIFELDAEEQKRIEAARSNFREQSYGKHDGSEGDVVTDHAPVNQFSTRGSRTLVLNTLRASFLMHQLERGVPYDKIQWEMAREDLVHLQTGSLLQGPGAINPTSMPVEVLVREDNGIAHRRAAQWDPLHAEISWKNPNGQPATAKFDRLSGQWTGADSAKIVGVPAGESLGIQPSKSALHELGQKIEQWEQQNPETSLRRTFQDNGVVDRILSEIPYLTADDRSVLQRISEGRKFFISRVNELLKTPTTPADRQKHKAIMAEANARVSRIKDRNARIGALKKQVTPGNWDNPAQKNLRLELTRLSYENLSDAYPGSEYVFKAILEAALSDQHVHLFGPPGGAKTAISRAVLEGLVDGLKLEGVDNYLWMQQFHKMVPEGKIIGFDNMRGTKAGEIKVDTAGTLVDPLVRYAIGDEMERGHPGVTTAGLTVMNERKATRGDAVIRSNLRTFVATTNLMPSEWLEAFGPSGEKSALATFDRIARKVYVSSKFDTPEELATFLAQAMQAKDLKPEVLFPIEALRDWKKKSLREEPEYVGTTSDRAISKFIQSNVSRQNEQKAKNKGDDLRDPYWYLSPSDGSDRTQAVNGSVWQSSVFLRDLLSGETASDPKREFTFLDLASAADTFRHQHSGQIEAFYEGAEGLLQFRRKSKNTVAMNLEARDRYLRAEMDQELDRWIETVNQEITATFMANREDVARMPDLFPELTRARRGGAVK